MRIECPLCGQPADMLMPLELPLPDLLDAIEKYIVERTLERSYNNQTYAARDLKIPFHAIRHLIKKHDLKK